MSTVTAVANVVLAIGFYVVVAGFAFVLSAYALSFARTWKRSLARPHARTVDARRARR